mmetsp:Transcript_986/g.2565  ORF Transcript_986/g.2565 Transcript_986/m.2565 type:complete len:325 (-) Transcript_986:58-1032(-)
MQAWRKLGSARSRVCTFALAFASATGARAMATPAPARTGLAVGQMRSTSSPEDNLARCAQLCGDAVSKGAAFLSLPECFEFMGTPGTGDSLRFAQPLDGELFSRYRAVAKEHNLWLSLGGFHEKSADDPSKMYNTHAIVDGTGNLVASYRKLHLFDVDYDGGFRESDSTHKGQEALLVTGTPIGNVGVATCYDIRFPELFTALRDAGADVLLAPSAFMPTTGAAHWEVLLRARAIETQCYVAAAAQWGQHNPKRASYGHALIVDPWGEVMADLGAEGDGVAVVQVDKEKMAGIRARMPVSSHRRRDVVAVVVKDGGLRRVHAAL